MTLLALVFRPNTPGEQDGLEVGYATGDKLGVAISLSNFGATDIPAGATVKWTVASSRGDRSGTLTLAAPAPRGSVTHIGNVNTTLVDAGTTRDASPFPVALTLRVEFADAAGDTVSNEWTSTLCVTAYLHLSLYLSLHLSETTNGKFLVSFSCIILDKCG